MSTKPDITETTAQSSNWDAWLAASWEDLQAGRLNDQRRHLRAVEQSLPDDKEPQIAGHMQHWKS